MLRQGVSIVPGAVLRDQGMSATLAAEKAAWTANALRWLRLFAMQEPEFTCEQYRARWYEVGFDAPHDAHVWGALFNHAAKAGLIVWTGRYRNAESAMTHCHPVKIWKRKA